ncbi:MAG: PAS domain S-box protein [Reichenbachiella sp.]|uniref:PAS domain-containing sensor histidine kinase n=1 Tax=Reichenbachiella sp. TaxID=2184521 RepID=UPI00326340B6
MLEEFKDKGTSTTEGLLKSILDSAFNGIMTFKSIRNDKKEIIDFEWLFVNDVAEEITGKKSEELLGSRLLEILPANKEAGLFDKYVEVVETRNFDTFEQHYSSGKTDKWFRVSVVKLGDGLTVNFQDISDLKGALLETVANERKYQRLFEESIDPIFHVDENFQILDTNPSFQRLFNYADDELVCMNFRQLFSDREDYKLMRKVLLDKGTTDELEVELVHREGEKKACIVNCASIRNEDNEQTFIGVIRDMTKRKQADREMIQAEKLSMTGKIARTIAHEVRNPLTNLTLALEQLKDEVPEQVEDAELYFNIISRNADRIGKLITDLLNSSKPKELQLKKQSMNQLVEEALDLVKDRLKLQSMELKKSLDEKLPALMLDSDQIKIALLNLFINAIEAMKPEVGRLFVSSTFDDERLTLQIQDNGKGISKENMNDLFEPFFTGKKEGTGLGLTTVQNIINSHKGRIKVESEVGKGTTFMITFPI